MTCLRPHRVPSSSPGSPDFVTGSQRPGSTPRCSSSSADVYHLSGTAQNAHLDRSRRRASRCCSCVATSSARAPRARSRRSSRSRACASLEPALRGLRRRPGLARSGSSSTCCPRRPTCATPRCCPTGASLTRCPPSGPRAHRRAPWELERVRAACAQGTAAHAGAAGRSRGSGSPRPTCSPSSPA